jgi:hypothetical protein
MARASYLGSARAMPLGTPPLAGFCAAAWPDLSPPLTAQGVSVGADLQFDLERLSFYSNWRGRLVIDFPPPERSWFRWVDRGNFPVSTILEESVFSAQPPDWREIDLTFAELLALPASWQARLSEGRGIYLIFDESDHRAYVGSAYGRDNIYVR